MAKADLFYFENINAAAEYAYKGAEYLVECLSDFNSDKMDEMLKKMHEYEHAGDMKKHELSKALARAFVTPIDREDLALISKKIDDVSDCIEEALQTVYIYRIKTITPEAVIFAQKIADCCLVMKKMLAELVRFKKPEKLHELIAELAHAEEECDNLYMDFMLKLNDTCKNVLDLIAYRELFAKLEECADACEHVGDSVDTVVMKNT